MDARFDTVSVSSSVGVSVTSSVEIDASVLLSVSVTGGEAGLSPATTCPQPAVANNRMVLKNKNCFFIS